MADTDNDYIYYLYSSDFLREPVMRSVIRTLELSPGSIGLDAGCGIGSHTLLLAESIMPGGQVIGLDNSPERLAYAKKHLKESELLENVAFQEGDLNRLNFDDNTFDWIWSVDCLAYIAEEPVSLMKELGRVLKPGGILAILAWSSQQMLPGYPILEARLNAAAAAVSPIFMGRKPEQHFMRATGWLHNAGFSEVNTQTFIGEVRAPLNDNVRDSMVAMFRMLWEPAQKEMSQEDQAEYQRLCQPKSPDCILSLPEYYAFFTYTLFYGQLCK